MGLCGDGRAPERQTGACIVARQLKILVVEDDARSPQGWTQGADTLILMNQGYTSSFSVLIPHGVSAMSRSMNVKS
jgi:hypothetical protein